MAMGKGNLLKNKHLVKFEREKKSIIMIIIGEAPEENKTR
jgi:hypothetical protein